jgi:hypothetical protein
VALFHLVLLAFYVGNGFSEPWSSPYWWQPAWMLTFSISWLFICDLKKWAALLYLALTALNLVLHFWLKPTENYALYIDALVPAEILFCFFAIYYYRFFN